MITPRQHRLLQFITGYIDAHGYGPSIAEMGEVFGHRNAVTGCKGSRSGYTARQLSVLEQHGFIRRIPNRARAIEVLRTPSIPRSPEGEPLFYVEPIAEMIGQG